MTDARTHSQAGVVVDIESIDQFQAWVTPALAAMTRLALRLAPQADPHDIVQDAFERAWRKRELYDSDRGTPTTWLLAITADTARSARRRRVRWSRIVDERAEVPDRAAPEVADRELDDAITRLSERQELAVQCHYFLDLTIADTAHVMGCSPGTVKSTLHDARARLRAILEMPHED